MDYRQQVWILATVICQTIMLAVGNDIPVMEQTEIHINITAGRTAILPCMVNTLTREKQARYKVVWMSPRMRPISYETETVISDMRFTVERPYLQDWNLKINPVREGDGGKYLCQLNTMPVQQKNVFLHVQVRPRISGSSDVKTIEGSDLALYCNASGEPTPSLQWYKDGQLLPQEKGEKLLISAVSREQSGIYRCVASNGVSPPASEDINVDIQYEPEVTVRVDRIGQVQQKEAVLECHVRDNPQGNVTWFKRRKKISRNWKYDIQIFNEKGDHRTSNLIIRSMESSDFGIYRCVAKNVIGRDEISMELYELVTTTKVTEKTNNYVTKVKTTTKHGYDTKTATPIEDIDNSKENKERTTKPMDGRNDAYVDKNNETEQGKTVIVVTDTQPDATSDTGAAPTFFDATFVYSVFVLIYCAKTLLLDCV